VTEQASKWSGDFGREYTDRNAMSIEGMDEMYIKRYGLTRAGMNARFLSDIPRDASILEVGCNIGNQLVTLKNAGFTSLAGLEVAPYALERARSRPEAGGIELVEGSALDIPFEDGSFDLVYTSGVLIHISPDDIGRVMSEVCRCSRKYIWGLEYYADEFTEVNYRGHEKLLWKADYASLYLDTCPGTKLLKKERFRYLDNPELEDAMYLIGK